MTSILFIVMLVFILAALAMLWMIKQSIVQAQNVMRPVNDLSNNVGTQMSQVGTQVSQVLHPTPTVIPDPITIIHSVRSLARLETIQYTVEKVITAETNQGVFGPLFGDKILFVAHGSVIAGIDLEKLQPDDLQLQGGSLFVHLPPAEIFVSTLDNEKSYVYDRETGLFTWGDVNLETTARRAAEDEIQKAALADGILDLAQQNAENYLSRLLRDLGYPDINFIHPDTTATPQP